MAHKSADRLQNSFCLRGCQRFKVEDKIGSGPQVGGLAT